MQIDTPDDSPPPEPPSDEPRTYTVALPDAPYITIAPHPKDIDTFGKIILLSGGGARAHRLLAQARERALTVAMRAVIKRAREAPNPTQRDAILRDSGLHDIDHFIPANGTPPLATDKGNFINEHGVDVQVTDIMAQFPRWRGLKHICNPLTKDFTDGQTHFDIFKCIIFVLAELLPRKSPLLLCLRTLLQIRMLAGLRVLTESRIELLKRLLRRYEACCKKVTDVYGKTFAWPKQHFLVHMIPDILAKGVLRNATTRTGEGMHQEVAQHYMHTNFRDVDPQVAHRDEEQEAIARTRLTVDDFFRRARNEGDGDQDEEENLKKDLSHQYLRPLGPRIVPPLWRQSQLRRSLCRERPLFRNFDPRLRSFLREVFPVEFLRYEDTVKIELFRCLYIAYQSQDDWREGEDILRCHADWYRRGPRYDCLLFDAAMSASHAHDCAPSFAASCLLAGSLTSRWSS
ncbi:hypothetical protein B0H14DRAFT_3436501 [Mycena olivaceomarginata]|nr:hypothetical protein B0H14DRAFT_3436501 [Mycena olivaceomarginata]